jgi:hypothetical protein
MEAMLGISLYSYLYLKLSKMLFLSYYCLCLLFNKIREEGRTGSAWKLGSGGGGGGQGARGINAPNSVCTYKLMNKKSAMIWSIYS